MNTIYFKGKLDDCNNYENSLKNKKLFSINKNSIKNKFSNKKTLKNKSNKNNHTIQKNKISNLLIFKA